MSTITARAGTSRLVPTSSTSSPGARAFDQRSAGALVSIAIDQRVPGGGGGTVTVSARDQPSYAT